MQKAVRYDELELLRGLAAVSVVIYHFLRAFLPPEQLPLFADLTGLAVERPFVLALINGPFMVTIFFVLSSFALTTKLLDQRRSLPVCLAVAKRFPRLFPLTLVGTMVPALLYALGQMYNTDAAALTGSEWLARSGGVKTGGGWPDPSIPGGLVDSIRMFVATYSQYNSALWTMRYELLGSVVALGTALAIAGKRRILFDVVVTLVVAGLALTIHPLCSICAVTVLIAKYLRHFDGQFSPWVSASIIFLGMLIGSTYKPFPEELAIDPLVGPHILRLDWLIHGVGAIMIFVAVHRWRREKLADWPLARVVGRLSFSIYVLHIPIIGSLASACVFLMGYNGPAIVLAAGLTGVVTLSVAHFVSQFDTWWVTVLNRFGRLLTDRYFGSAAFAAQGSDAP